MNTTDDGPVNALDTDRRRAELRAYVRRAIIHLTRDPYVGFWESSSPAPGYGLVLIDLRELSRLTVSLLALFIAGLVLLHLMLGGI